MDRRDFLWLMASAGALSVLGPGCPQPGGQSSDVGGGGDAGPGDGGPGDAPGPPPDSRIDYVLRAGDASLTPYLVIPKLDPYQADDPVWNDWAGVAWTDLPHPPSGLWFSVPEVGQSVDVVVPVINLGNKTSTHLVIEVLEGPKLELTHVQTVTRADCALRDRRGPLVLHPGRITGFRMQFTRKHEHGSAVALCYDPFFDPVHAIDQVGWRSEDRKNMGNCAGLKPPHY